MPERKVAFTVILLISFGLSVLFSLALQSNHLTGQTQLAGEAKFPRWDHDKWRFTQYNPELEAAVKITSTINTYFRILYKSLINGTLYDFSFLFDQTSPEAIKDYAYERGLLWVWIARWKDYGVQLNHFDYMPKFTELNTSQGAPFKVRVDPDAFLYFKDDLNKAEPSPLSNYKFVLILKDKHWLIQSVKGYSPNRNLYPHGSDFNEIASAIPHSIEISTPESEYMMLLNRENASPRILEIRKKIEERHKGEKKLTINDIKRNYKFWHIEKIIRFDDIYTLVESSRPTLANRYEFYNLMTGERQLLPTSADYVRLYKIKSPHNFLFYADGTNHINYARSFPFIVECSRGEDGKKFMKHVLTRYYPLSESVVFGGKSIAKLIDLKITLNGIECAFGPVKGFKGEFYAAYTDIPRTKTSYNKEKHQFIITFVNTNVNDHVKNFDAELKIENIFLDSVELKEEGSDCKIIVNLKNRTKYYTGKKDWIDPSRDTPCVKFIFITQHDYDQYVLLEL